ncbi:NADH dehydrogenase [Alphaproteobacteria bacterium]|nr:NADH dehydrogenase [Alphaproteobacteria bacterium]
MAETETNDLADKLKALAAKQVAALDAMGKEHAQKEAGYEIKLYTCNSTGCNSGGAAEVIEAMTDAINSHGYAAKIRMVSTGCMGLCGKGPLVRVEIQGQEPVMYCQVNAMIARLIAAEHIMPAIAWLEGDRKEPFTVSPYLKEHELSLKLPFFTRQHRIVLANMGRADPENLGEYIASGGYEALRKALLTQKPADIVEEVKKSGLRGRGGGGFPTGVKWELTAKSAGADEKFIICNGDEGDPGAYMDACILGGGPHQVIEGMMLAAYAIGATYGWFYIRAEYPLALARIEGAIKQCKKYGILGKNIFGSGWDFMCDLRYGAGAFVCGEETALMASIEGRRGTPRPRPPYPAVRGLWDKPSCINNVETLATVPTIIRKGADWYKTIGIEGNAGTKVFALTGHVNHSGLIEVPMGMTIREIVEEVGGGTDSGLPLKAVQTGGPSGGVIPKALFDTQLSYEALKKMGSMMGSGGMIVMDEKDSMVEIAKFYLGFTVDESCGKCAPCRIGGYHMLKIMERIAKGKGKPEDLETLKELAFAMQKASLCGLGQTAPNPVVSTLKHFEDEYKALIKA